MSSRKGEPYRAGELEIILSLVPSKANIRLLAILLERSEDAIEIVYKIAYTGFQPSGSDKGIQVRKVKAAKTQLGIAI